MSLRSLWYKNPLAGHCPKACKVFGRKVEVLRRRGEALMELMTNSLHCDQRGDFYTKGFPQAREFQPEFKG